jgi:kynurenine formamidase
MDKIMQLTALIESMEVMDLSQILEENIPVWPTHSKFMHNVWHSLELDDDSTNYQIIMNEHNGTHVDMPCHYIKEGEVGQLTAENMPLTNFFGPYKKIDCTTFGQCDALEKEDIVAWEAENGPINEGDIVLVDFGWSKYWALKPKDKAFITRWPGVGESAAIYLAEIKIKLLGVDTLAADVFGSDGDPTHNTLLSQKICIMENLKNLEKIKNKGYFISQPLKIKDGSASPVRPVALYEK